MALDATAWESNVRDSIKKYFVDNLVTNEGLVVTFDTDLATPNIQGDLVDRWIVINFAAMDLDKVSRITLDIYCCARKDAEGFKLTKLKDKLMGYLTDSSHNDGRRRIPFYRSHEDPNQWTLLGGFLVDVEEDSGNIKTPDGTKIKMIPATLRWGAKV